MKKIILIIALVLCVAVAGTALALTTFNNASDVTGTLTADTYLSLSLDSCSTTALQLEVGTYSTPYTIDYDVTKSTNAPTATLTLTLAAANEKTLNGVTVTLWTDSNCTVPLKLNTTTHVIDAEGTAASLTGAGSISVAGLTTDGLIYAKFYLDSNATASAIGGTMTLNLVETQA